MTTNKYPESWMWDQHGEKIVGIVTDRRVATTKYGPADVLEVRSENHEMQPFSVWCTSKALKDFLRDSMVKPGDKVSIHRVGKEAWTSKDGEERSMWVFDAVVLTSAPDLPVSEPSDESQPASDDIPF